MRTTLNIFIFLTLCFSYAQAERGKVARRLVGPFANTNTRVTKPRLKRFGEAKNYHLPKPNLSVNFKNKGKDPTESSTQNNASPNTDLNLSGVSGAGGISGINPAGLRPGDLNPNINFRSLASENPSEEQPKQTGTQQNQNGSDGSGISPPTNKPLPYWLPMCFFFDSNFSENYARQAIKKVVDAYAYCGVAIKVHSKTLRAGSYNPDDPKGQKAAASYHCDARQYYPSEDVKYQAAQSYPNSNKASDYMCDKPKDIEDKEKGRKDWTVAGCAEQPGEFSIVDRAADGNGAGGVGVHELGHNVGRPGRGGDELENEGENGVKTVVGWGLQMKNSPVDKTKTPQQHDEGSHTGDGKFTEQGCASVRGGANDNSKRKMPYNPNAFAAYYKFEMNPERQLAFQPAGKKFLSPRDSSLPTGDVVPPKLARGGGRSVEGDSLPSSRSSTDSKSGPTGAHPKGIASGKEDRGSSVRTGDAVTVNGGSLSSKRGERGSDDSAGPGELPPLNGPGKASDENTIVGKRSEGVWGSNNGDPSQGGSSSGGDNSFFASGDGAEGRSSEGSSGGDSSGQGSDSMNVSFAKGDSSDRLDPDFFKKTQGAKNIAEKSSRTGARNSGDIAQPSESVVQRSLASKPEISQPDKQTSGDPSKNSYVVNPPKNPSTRGTGRGKSQLGYENNI